MGGVCACCRTSIAQRAFDVFAGPVSGETFKLTNSDWIIDRAPLAKELGVERAVIVNDFGAVAHAVAGLGEDSFRHVCGPSSRCPAMG